MRTDLTLLMGCNLLLSLLNINDVAGASKECIKNAECQCVIENTKTGINLNGVNTTITNTSINHKEADGLISIAFNPCKTLNSTNTTALKIGNYTLDSVIDGCNGTSSICLTVVAALRINIGNYQELRFVTEDDGSIYLSSSSNGWSTRIFLRCNNVSDDETLTLVEYSKSQKTIDLQFSSKRACVTENVIPLNDSSGWRTFFIVIFIVIFVYFVGGILFKKIFFDAYGMELLPNHLFWINVIESVADFLQYVSNGCRRPNYAYNEI